MKLTISLRRLRDLAFLFIIGLCLGKPAFARADLVLSSKGKAQSVILSQPGATLAEQHAAAELKLYLEQITQTSFTTEQFSDEAPEHSIIVGGGPAADKYFPEIDLKTLGADEMVMRSRGNRLLLAGGRPRGTLYAVNRFLQEQCGVRWWTSWATNIPTKPNLRIPNLNIRYKPPFEYRAPFWYPAFEQTWKVHNGSNDENWLIPAALGGSIRFKGFAHTFYKLVPPAEHFDKHPEWFSLVNGKRTHERGQLCLTNPKLREFVVERVKQWLRECPDCEIVSVTQNDWYGFCECPDCKALDQAEGSQAGTMVAFANYIAEQIEPEFPRVAVDTFAYQYTRKPPKTLKPRHNVIIRLCSIECNFREPLDHPSNAAFAEDIRNWSKICSRLYVWDYTTDFRNYIHPHPNWFTLGPNVRFFEKHGVKGLFEQGAYAGHGAEMAEMRAWVLVQLLWNPKQDDRALIKEFLQGYYGREAAKLIYRYFELVHESSKGLFLGCFLSKEPPPHLDFDTLAEAEKLWQRAEAAVQSDPEKLLRVRIAHLPVRYAFLKYWNTLRHEAWEQNLAWPLHPSRKVVAEEFRTVCQGVPGKPWTQIRALSEHGLKLDEFLEKFDEDPKPLGPTPPPRLKNPPPPADLGQLPRGSYIILQDNAANLAGFGKWAEILPDETASDRRAVWMPGDHREWAFRIPGKSLPPKAQSGRWKIYAVVRVKKGDKTANPDAIAFSAGVYDIQAKTYPANLRAPLEDAGNAYRSYLVGEVEMTPNRDIWICPPADPAVKAIWIDRVILVNAQ